MTVSRISFIPVAFCVFIVFSSNDSVILGYDPVIGNGVIYDDCSFFSEKSCPNHLKFSPIPHTPYSNTERYSPQERMSWQILPNGLIYPSYLAGPKEPRIGLSFTKDYQKEWFWDFTLGGRAGLIRYGTWESVLPTGFQIDLEGAVSGRMDLMHDRDMVANDFRFGFPITFGTQFWQFKGGYYHVSSHMGDEYMISNHIPSNERLNYYRESVVGGIAFRPHVDLRLYAEVGLAIERDAGAEPLEFQLGFEYSPVARKNAERFSNTLVPTSSWQGSPFFAINVYLREENNFGGNLSLQTGWQFRGESNHLFRVGLYYFNGKSDQYQFFRTGENRIGFGLWYDF